VAPQLLNRLLRNKKTELKNHEKRVDLQKAYNENEKDIGKKGGHSVLTTKASLSKLEPSNPNDHNNGFGSFIEVVPILHKQPHSIPVQSNDFNPPLITSASSKSTITNLMPQIKVPLPINRCTFISNISNSANGPNSMSISQSDFRGINFSNNIINNTSFNVIGNKNTKDNQKENIIAEIPKLRLDCTCLMHSGSQGNLQ
jgi:hypothetical protein